MTALKNRHNLMLLASLLMFCVLLSSPAIASSQSVLQDDGPLLTERNWNFADLPEGPIVYNNLEDYVDQLSDLHNESDIGTHSNPAVMRALDSVYDTLTSDNITIPEQLIEDPLNETPPYNQSAYESWRLDLEGGWINIDYDEISAELCVYGGTQAEEALRVDIWDNGGWINVISDVVVGWNNVSISPSLIDKSLEMRFTGSNTDNTSVQSSWDIDAVLIHTWTTVYGSELTQSGIIQDLGNNLSRYIGSVGEMNTWDDTSDTWYRYLYDSEEKTVKIGNLTISHLEGGALSIDGDAGSRVGKLSWFIQAYYGDQWNNITLDNYEFAGFTKTADNVTAHQRFWGTQGEMNVYLTYSYFGGFKTRVDIRNDATQAVPIRAIWAARDVSGIQDNYELLYNEDGVLYGIQIEDAAFSWYDVLVSDNPLPTQTVVDKPNRRAAVIFGNQSTIIPSGYTASIDPTYAVAADADDNYWNVWEAPVRYDSATDNKIQTDGATYTYATTFRMALTIVPYSTVTQASLSVYASAQSGVDSVTIKRINALSAAVLEGGSYPSIDSSPTGAVLINAIGWETSDEIGDLVQEQINQAGWTSGYYMGFKLEPTGVCGHTIHDYQKGAQPPYLTVTFEEPSSNWLLGYGYRQGHSIDGATGAGTYYQVKIAVEYGSGTSASGTIYCNSHSQTDFDDIRFTDNDGQTELAYWMEWKTDSDVAAFWVEVTDDLGSDRVIYCYYGNAGVSTTSSGTNTFLFFDDFNDGSLHAKWTTYTGTPVESGGVLTCTGINQEGVYSDDTWTYGRVKSRSYLTPPSSGTYGGRIGMLPASAFSGSDLMTATYWVRTAASDTGARNGDADTIDVETIGDYDSAWYYYEILWQSASIKFYIDSNLMTTHTDTNDIYNSALPVGMNTYASTGSAVSDWIFLGKYVVTEPSNYNWGREQVAPNNPPTVEPQPNVALLDDTDNLYSRYRKYEVTTYYKDFDGYADIDYVQFYVYNEARDTLYFYGKFIQNTHVFSEEDDAGGSKASWGLDTGGSTYSEHDAYYLDVTWKFYIEWVCPDVVNLDVRCYVIDAEPESDSLYYDYLWDGSNNRDCDIETDLDWSSVPTVTDDDAGTVFRGDLNEAFTMAGTLKYQGSALVPPDTDVDVWVSCASVASSPWSDMLGSSGTYTVTCYADDVVGSDDFTMKPVKNNGGSGGASLYYTTDLTDAYIADRAEIYSIIAPDDHVGASTGTTIQYYIRYDYFDQAGVTGTFTTDTTNDALVYQSGNQWDATVNEPFGVYTFNGFTTCAESQHGLTGWTFTGSDESIDFDTVRALDVEVSDDRCNYGSNQWVRVRFDYQSASYGYVTSWNTPPQITGPNGAITLNIDDGSGWWRGTTGTYSSVARFDYNTNTLNNYIDADSILSRSKGAYTDYTIWDRTNLTLTSNLPWTIIDYNTTLSATGIFEYNGDPWSGVITWADQFPSESTVGSYDYGASMISSITDPDYDVTVFAVGEEATVIFDDIVPSGSVAYYWTTPVSPNLDSVNLIWGAGSNWLWDYNDTLLNVAVIFTSYSNGSAPSGSGGTYGSGAFGGLTTGLYSGIVWNYVEFSINTTVTIAGIPYDWEIWSAGITVVVPHSLTTSVWFFYKDGDYYQLLMHTNYENASVMVWDDMEVGGGYDDSIYYGDYEGMHEWLRDTTVGTHQCTILINAGADKGAVARNYVANDLRLWYNFTYAIAEPTAYDCHIVILDSLYQLIPFDTFEVYRNGTRIYHDIIRVTDGYGYQIEVKNRYGDTVNSTAFGADREMVIFVNVYSLKFWSAYEGFCVLTISRGGVDYSEVLMPMEIVNFRLYSATYTYSIDYQDDVIMSGNVNLLASTGVVITNDTISDIFGLIDAVWDMSDAINITVNTVADNTYLIQLMFDWTNTTLYNQSITILASFNWENTTLYNQTISLLSAFNATNTVIYDQIILIQNMFNWENTTLFNQTISILNAFNATNTVIYGQTISILSEISSMNATIYGQTVSLLNYLYFNSSSIYNQTIDILTQLSLIGSNITANYISLGASLVAIDSSLLANFTSVSATLLAIDSSLLSNFTSVTADLVLINSALASNFTAVVATLSAIDSNITANYLSIAATLSMIDSNLFSNFTSVTATLSAIGTNITANYLSVSAILSMIDSALLSNFTDLTAELLAVNSTIGSQFLTVSATLSMLDSSLLSNFTSVSATLLMIDSALLSNFTSVTATLSAIGSNVTSNYLSVAATLSMIDSSLLSNFTAITSTLSTIGSNITTNYLAVSATLSMLDSSLLSNFTEISATLLMIDSQLLSNFTSVTSTLTTIGSNITSNYLSVSATLSMIDSQLLSNFTDLTAELLLVNSSLATQFLSVSATLSMLDSSLLSNFTAVTATLSMIDSSLLSNFTSVTSTLSAIGSNVTANYISVVATLSAIDSNLLSNFTSITATLSMIDSALLSNFTELTAELLAVNSTIGTQFLSVAATLSLLDSSLLSNFTVVSATLSMIDSNLLSNFTSVTATLSAIGSNITTNYLAITAELALIDSSLAANFTTMMTKLIATNSSLFIQTLAIISDLEFLNATMYLIDDPTHLNPLVLGHSYSDDYCDLTIVTTWHNASISVYDNDVLRTGPTSELLCPIRYPLLTTAGTHNLSIFVDGGNDSFWHNISYTVAEIVAFELEDWDVTPHLGVENHLECIFRTTWGNSTIYVYLNDSLQTSVLEQEGGISFSFWMTGTPGLHEYVFNVTSGTNVITITWDFYLPDWADTGLVVRWDMWTFQNNYTLITLESNWMNCTYYLYLNDSLVATSYNDPVTLNFTRSLNNGTYNLTIYADGGASTYTIKNIRYIVTDEGVTYDFSSFSGGLTIVEGDTYEGDNVTIHENPTGMFVDQATAAIIAVGGFLIIFTAFLVAREIRKRDQEKTERMYSQ